VFRSDSVLGPWEPYEHNPILTQRHLDPDRPDPITSAGHADFVQLDDGTWWTTFLATRPYEGNHYNTGRETFLLPVTWKDGWPVVLEGDATIPYAHKRPNLPRQQEPEIPNSGNYILRDDFKASNLAPYWTFARIPKEDWYDLASEPGTLSIQPRDAHIGKKSQPSFIARRQQHTHASASTEMRYAPQSPGDRAGLVAFQSDDYYIFFGLVNDGGRTMLRIDRRSGPDAPADGETVAETEIDASTIRLRIDADGGSYSFLYATGPGDWRTLAADVDGSNLSTQSAGGFVGVVIGMYAYSSAPHTEEK